MDVSKWCIAGDWHGNFRAAKHVLYMADRNGCDRVIQCGDFGVFPFYDCEGYFDALQKLCEQLGLKLYFLCGNHDDLSYITNKYTEKTDEGFDIVRDNIFHMPRGASWNWDGLNCSALGGAVSIDKVYRLAIERGEPCPDWGKYDYNDPTGPGTMWFPDEQITPEDVEKTSNNALRPVDILFTHDGLTNMPMKFMKVDHDSQINRQLLTDLVKDLKPRYIFAGHMHHFMHYEYDHGDSVTQVYQLNMENEKAAFLTLEPDKLDEL